MDTSKNQWRSTGVCSVTCIFSGVLAPSKSSAAHKYRFFIFFFFALVYSERLCAFFGLIWVLTNCGMKPHQFCRRNNERTAFENIILVGPLPGDQNREIVFPVLSPDPRKDSNYNFGKYSIHIGGNRGRGQVYPTGEKSNNNLFTATNSGIITSIMLRLILTIQMRIRKILRIQMQRKT